eukprot:CAMPEP_0197455606 /NCGR_PEP_ID=MMETSP1175-20131217/41153_1 /TAXON_ID=1003142 /ORGANISM="Triceratium dubium, Strain CCMP147" /LENGTH=291 /DNA_ID=CAMNT_0042989503 /DNA_START=108 /DNA_END=983 /DNA_ORIENTATION=+
MFRTVLAAVGKSSPLGAATSGSVWTAKARPVSASVWKAFQATSGYHSSALVAHDGCGKGGDGDDSKTGLNLEDILAQNKEWVDNMNAKDDQFFKRLASGQSPKYLWIGCSDSRVPANQIMGLGPGEVFVHRNVANLVVGSDLNFLSCLQFAVEVLKVEHIIVCGHYDCGGVRNALKKQDLGLIENWIRAIRDVARLHKDELFAIEDEEARSRRLVELNVIEQVLNVYKTGVVQKRRHKTFLDGESFAKPRVHGLVFDPAEGRLNRLEVNFKEMIRNYRHVYDLYDDEADRI